MYDIFLSYSTKDRDRLEPLYEALKRQGWTVFWDHKSIHTGQHWHRNISETISSSRCVVVAWSKHSVHSDYVLEEAMNGKSRHVLLPIKIDALDPPFGFAMLQTGDFVGWNRKTDHLAFVDLAAQIRGLLGTGGTLPPPPPPPPPPRLGLWIAGFVAMSAIGGYVYTQQPPKIEPIHAASMPVPEPVDPVQTKANELAQAKAALDAADESAWPAAVKTLEALVNSGNTEAMQVLGTGYYVGQGVGQDQPLACKLFKQAVGAGDAKAKETYANLPKCQ